MPRCPLDEAWVATMCLSWHRRLACMPRARREPPHLDIGLECWVLDIEILQSVDTSTDNVYLHLFEKVVPIQRSNHLHVKGVTGFIGLDRPHESSPVNQGDGRQ